MLFQKISTSLVWIYLSAVVSYIVFSLSFLHIKEAGWGVVLGAAGIFLTFFQRHYFRKYWKKLEHLQKVKDFVFDDEASVSSHTGDNSFIGDFDIEEEFR